MFTKFNYENTANEIRTKLLLFIDKEIQTKIKQKKLFYNPQNKEQKNITLYSSINKMYSNQQNKFFISFNKFEKKISKNEVIVKKNRRKSQQSISTYFASPITNDKQFQNGNVKNFSVYHGNPEGKRNSQNYYLYNNIINIKKNRYSIKKLQKPTSTFQIYKKPKTDRKYLKNLCNSLKIINKNELLFNRQVKSRLTCTENNRKQSSPIKNAKKKQSSIIKTNENNLDF